MHLNPYVVIALYFLFSAVVGGMPDPIVASPFLYLWCYRSAHILAGNLQVAIQSKFPTLPEPLPPNSIIDHHESITVMTPPKE
jgi:hypothetical protein